MEIFCKSQTVLADFQASDRFLESFFISLSDTHNFTNGAHLSAQLVFDTFELFKCPTRELDYHVISVRNVFVQCAVFAARNLIQIQPGCQHGRYKSDRETGSLTCQC